MKKTHKLIKKASNPNEFRFALNSYELKYKTSTPPLTTQVIEQLFKERDQHYHCFEIKKKSGKKRTIAAPDDAIKDIQYRIKNYLEAQFVPHESAHGFIAKKGIHSNASAHVGQPFVLNVDIKDFFPSIDFHRIKKTLTSRPYKLSDFSANTIAHFACYKGRLPQGGVLSPIISNIVCKKLDKRLSNWCSRKGFIYTRYVDDITISGKKNPLNINSFVRKLMNINSFMRKLKQTLKSYGFELQPKKTRLQSQEQRQSVTGLVVNEKVNVPQNSFRHIRAILFRVERDGWHKAQKHHESLGFNSNLKQYVQGKIAFIRMVRGADCPRVQALEDRWMRLQSTVNQSF